MNEGGKSFPKVIVGGWRWPEQPDQFLQEFARNFSLFVKLSCQGNLDLISSHFINKTRNIKNLRGWIDNVICGWIVLVSARTI